MLYNNLCFSGLGLAGNGIVMLATPFLTSLAGLVIVTTVGGVMFGYLNSGERRP